MEKNHHGADSVANKERMKIYEESDHYQYLLYHNDCRALVGKANILNRFDDFEMICHNCKKVMPINKIKFVRIEKKAK